MNQNTLAIIINTLQKHDEMLKELIAEVEQIKKEMENMV